MASLEQQNNGPSAPTPPPGPSGSYAAPAARKGHGVWIPIIILVALIAVIAVACASCSSALFGSKSSSYSPNTVAIIDIDSTIGYNGTACSPEGLKSLLDEASSDDNVKAVVLRVNSGGGTATAGEEMASYVRDFDKPVVVSSASVNASAAYEVSSQADWIFVANTTEIGAIGTDLTVTDYSGLLEMLGVNVDNITSADSKDSSYGTRPLTDEERAYYQDLVNQINGFFIDNVATGRDMSTDDVTALATGLVFTGATATQNGLADEVGTLEDACSKAADLAGCSDYSTQHMEDPGSTSITDLLGSLTGSSQSTDTTALAKALKELESNGNANQ